MPALRSEPSDDDTPTTEPPPAPVPRNPRLVASTLAAARAVDRWHAQRFDRLSTLADDDADARPVRSTPTDTPAHDS